MKDRDLPMTAKALETKQVVLQGLRRSFEDAVRGVHRAERTGGVSQRRTPIAQRPCYKSEWLPELKRAPFPMRQKRCLLCGNWPRIQDAEFLSFELRSRDARAGCSTGNFVSASQPESELP